VDEVASAEGGAAAGLLMVTRVLNPHGPLQVERRPDGRRELLRPLRVRAGHCGCVVEVPPGFVTDYSSIPWLARPLVHWSKVDVAGVVHDCLYRQGVLPKENRYGADRIWRLIAMSGSHRANWFQAWIGHFGLWIGGWLAFHRHPVSGHGGTIPSNPAPVIQRCSQRSCKAL